MTIYSVKLYELNSTTWIDLPVSSLFVSDEEARQAASTYIENTGEKKFIDIKVECIGVWESWQEHEVVYLDEVRQRTVKNLTKIQRVSLNIFD